MDAAIDASTSQFELNEEQRAIQEMAQAIERARVEPAGRHAPVDPGDGLYHQRVVDAGEIAVEPLQQLIENCRHTGLR